MKKEKLYIFLGALALILLLSSCSTRKNTWLSRNFHSLTTRYNINFNGYDSYNEGAKKIVEANEDDFSTIIPMFPISNHSNTSAASSNMDRTIEKGRKAIKLHSIKQKPKRDNKKWNDPEYRTFYNQNEFNPAIKDAWMMIGKAEFHKGDFLGSIGTFTYIAKHYDNDKDLVAQCQLWMVRAYVEMDWLYEAEDLFGKINQADLKNASTGLLASTNAVLLLKRDQYKEAIPFVELALSREKDKALKQRFAYLLAQLYQVTGDEKAAINAYSDVIKMNPPYVMDFNARINRAQLNADNDLPSILKELRKMLKNPNNKDYLDQLYYVMGNAYIQNGDTAKAIENYNLSVESSTRNGVEKAVTLITLGDLYYSEREYIKAEPAYAEAATIITNEHDDYARVSKLAEVLGELNVHHQVVVLQDSLQHLSTLSEEERLKVINKVIEDLIAEEKRAEERALELARREAEEGERFVPVGGPLSADAGKWYFYNANLMKTGKSDFQKLWGNRKLEDNWRRTTKSATMFGTDSFASETSGMEDESELQEGMEMQDAATPAPEKTAEVLDNKQPEFYLRQIPVTPEQIKKSNEQIADGLFNMGMIYKDKINDLPMAIETYDEFIRRFGSDKRLPDAYFELYLVETKQGNALEADKYRQKIIADYPDTKYAQILSQPDYIERFALMQKQQDSLYNATYHAYSNNDFLSVSRNVAYAKANYPLSKLMPKFMFLNALSIGKTDTPQNFEKALNELVATYPQSDVSAMAKDIAALIRQGNEAQTGTSHGTLLARRETEFKAEQEEKQEVVSGTFSGEKQSKHRLMLISTAQPQDMYQLMYQVAAFNFTRFMIKEFDLILSALDENKQVLSITNFESYDEVLWYMNSINADLTISQLLAQLNIEEVPVSEDNFALLKSLGLDEYLAFNDSQLKGTKPVKSVAVKQPAVTIEKPQEVVPAKPVEQLKPTPPTPQISQVPQATETPVKADAAKPEITEIEETLVEELINSSVPQVSESVEVTVEKPEEEPVATPPAVEEPEEVVPLYKGLFGYQPEKPHYVAMYVISGKVNFEKIKTDFDAYNAENYGMLNLNVSLETVGSQQVVLIGSFTDANLAKSYLLRIVKEKALFEGFKGTNYRNVLGTQKNLNVMIKNNALKTYNEFMQEYYLK